MKVVIDALIREPIEAGYGAGKPFGRYIEFGRKLVQRISTVYPLRGFGAGRSAGE